VQQALMPAWNENMLEMSHQQAQTAWGKEAEEAKKRIRKELGVATKEYDRECQNHRAGVRERARRLGQTGRIFRELLGARRANGKEILTLGEGDNKKFLYTAEAGTQGLLRTL